MNHDHTHHSHSAGCSKKKERKQEGVEEVIFNNPAGILSGIALTLDNPEDPSNFYKIEFSEG